MRASGVFTGTTNSPSRSPRQSFDRYAIRAGRNLPDKEFRSIHPAPFPEGSDFIFLDRDSFSKQWRGSRSMPSGVRCSPLSIIRRTSRNLRKSSCFCDLSGCFSKNGTMILPQMLEPSNSKGHPVVVIRSNHSATEECLQRDAVTGYPARCCTTVNSGST